MTSARQLPLADQIALLSGLDVWHTQPLPDAGVRSVMLSDGPHGLRKQEVGGDHLGTTGSKPATCFPPAVTLASSWDPALLHEVGAALGREAAAEGVAVVLGPGLNIKRHPHCGRNFEYLSEDPLVAGRLAAAMVEGIQSQGVGACLKHFAVNNQEAHRLVVDAVVDERTLRELYLAGFEHAVTQSRPWTIMAAYNAVNGTFCTDHHRLLTSILRDEWGFDGLVMSDWGATNDRVAGVHAGMDLEMPGSGGVSDGDVAAAVASGKLAAEAVVACADRVLHLVDRAPSGPVGDTDHEEHHELARRAAAESTVLLTNDGILPLSPDRRVTVIGAFAKHPRFQGFGSSLVNPTRVDTAWDALSHRGVTQDYAPGYDPLNSVADEALIADAERIAADADVVVLMVGLPGVDESEGFDRTRSGLPPQHDALVRRVCAVNPRTVVVLSNGSPVTMPWVDQPAAIVEAYLGGQASGSALGDVLFGDHEPAGRLAETFPVRQADVPSDQWFPGHPHQVEYREGLAVGYRAAETVPAPLFCFGHGLGYTTFEYGDVSLNRTRSRSDQPVLVTVPVTNTGTRTGSDVVQVYVHDTTGAVVRPRRELRGFAKVRLDPGQTEQVVIELPPRAFAYYDVASAEWRVPAGVHVIEVGASSQDIRTSTELTITGTAPHHSTESSLTARSDTAFAARLGRSIPIPRPDRPFTRLTTVGELRLSPLGRIVRSGLHRYTRGQFEQMADGDDLMAERLAGALDEMPLRAAVLFTDGTVPWSALDGLLAMLNGRPLSALRSGALTVGTFTKRLATGLRGRLGR